MTEVLYAALIGLGLLAAFVLLTFPDPEVGAGDERAPREVPSDIVDVHARRDRRPIGLAPALVAEHLAKAYGDGRTRRVVFRNVSLVPYPGELVCVVAENAAGKSTLLRLLALNERPTAGRVIVRGNDAWALDRAGRDDLKGKQIAYVYPPQEGYGLLPVSPIDNIALSLHRVDGMVWPDIERRAEDALRAVDWPEGSLPPEKWRERIDLDAHNFSGGQLARVAVAAALALRRPVCLADEPLATLDDEAREAMVALFRGMANEGTAVAVIAHGLTRPFLAAHFDRVLELGGDGERWSTQVAAAGEG